MVQRVTRSQIYAKSYSSSRFFSVSRSQISPFTPEAAREIDNAKTQKLIEDVLRGRTLRTMGALQVWQENKFTRVSKRGQRKQRQCCKVEVQPFIFSADEP